MISKLPYIRRLFITVSAISLILASIPSLCNADSAGWKNIFPGIMLRTEALSGDFLLHVATVRIDTTQPGIRFLVTPSNGEQPADAAAQSTSEFLVEQKCQVAINGSVFSPYAKAKGDPLDIIGISISDGNLYSKPNRFHALLFDKKGRPQLVKPPFDLSNTYNGLSGYYLILQNGKNEGSSRKKDPRTVAGLSKDKRYLYLAVFDGRQPGYSDGATLHEAAEYMRKLGSWTALNLDGGGSTTLVIEGSDKAPRIMNRPSEGAERRVANHLCVFAPVVRSR